MDRIPDTDPEQCKTCKGSGIVVCELCHGAGHFEYDTTRPSDWEPSSETEACNACEQQGERECECRGTGLQCSVCSGGHRAAVCDQRCPTCDTDRLLGTCKACAAFRVGWAAVLETGADR